MSSERPHKLFLLAAAFALLAAAAIAFALASHAPTREVEARLIDDRMRVNLEYNKEGNKYEGYRYLYTLSYEYEVDGVSYGCEVLERRTAPKIDKWQPTRTLQLRQVADGTWEFDKPLGKA